MFKNGLFINTVTSIYEESIYPMLAVIRDDSSSQPYQRRTKTEIGGGEKESDLL